MKSDAIAFGVAGIVFGLIAGWIIGSQQALVRAAALRARRPRQRSRAGGRDAAPPVLDEAKVTRSSRSPSASRRTPRRACSSAICTSTPNATTTRSRGTARR